MSIIHTIQQTHHQQKTLSNSVYQTRYGEHSLLVITHPNCTAAISLHGAHLLYWQPTASPRPVIWLSENSAFKQGTAIRGGIPICWPWFGKMAEPAHGFARIVNWQLLSCHENAQTVEVILSLRDNEQTRQYWPHAFQLQLTLQLGTTCQVELTYQGDVTATSALHSYFGISDISAITVSGLGETYAERLTTNNPPKVSGEMRFDQSVDRIYTAPPAVTLIKDSDQTITITHRNHSDVVTWTPWQNAANMSDLQDDSYQHFVCVETCRISVPLQSTAKHSDSYGVKIEVNK